jgi:AraC-like DNA-binding protein
VPISTPDYDIFQVGAYYYAKLLSIPPHKQLFDIELTVCLSDGIKCYADDREAVCNKNDVYISFKDEIHKINSKRASTYQFIALNLVPESKMNFLLTELRGRYKGGEKINNDKEIPRIMNEIFLYVRLQEDAQYNNFLINAKITEILVRLLHGKKYNLIDQKNSAELIPRICNYIDNYYLEIESLSELAPHFGYTYEYLSALFKKNMKKSLHEYLKIKKMERAQILLSENKMTVSEVSSVLGYASPNNFTRAYQNHFGRNPTAEKTRG